MSESVIHLDLSRQKLYMSPNDPLPEFYPPPRVIQITPIYDTPFSESPSAPNGPTHPWIINRNSQPIESNPEYYNAPSSRHDRDDLPYGYFPSRDDQRYDPNPYYPEHPRDPYSRPYFPNRSGRRRYSDYDDSSDDDRSPDDDYSSDDDHSSDYDRPPSDDDRSSLDDDRPPPQHYHQNLSQHNRSARHEQNPPPHINRSEHYDPERPSHTANAGSSSQHHHQSSSQPNHLARHESSPPPHPNRSGHRETERPTNPISALQRYLEHNRQAAHRDPFSHLKLFPEEIQRVLKALPPSPNFCWSECTGRRKAVCVGINYVGQKNQLKGCANDARHMRSFLMKYHQFQSQDILLLSDDNLPVSMKPTRKNMFDAMKWLVKDAKMHDSLFFHYSGHGGQVKDETGKECDGMDEVIFPVDFQSTSHIVDNDLFTALVAPLPTGCRLTAVFDSCHSGTVLDLPYLHSAHGRLRSLVHTTKRALQRGVAPSADVICFAGCKDDETSADTFVGGVAVGAMSYALLKILKGIAENHTHLTYCQILQQLRAILVPKYSQKPQISGTHPIDLDRDFTL